jgi:UDP-3-O-[3-hydroxymyristoyl] glucosamine N-acyltransferase
LHYSLGDLAYRLGAELHGQPDAEVSRIDSLASADADSLCFFADKKYRSALKATKAGAVILAPEDRDLCPVAAIVSADPYLTYARAARLLHPPGEWVPGRHPSAVISAAARIDPSAHIGPAVVVEDGTEIGPRVYLGPGCVIGADCRVGEGSRLVARVTLCAGTRVGKRALIQPGAVIGADGFGFAKDGDRWERIPQLGGVSLGDDVEVGANTCVDRGALGDTVIGDGVKLDNLIQIGHNCRVGENTAMAACSGISGSTRIGRNCTVAGAVGMAGHLEIADGVHFTGMAMVTKSCPDAGVYSSGIPAMPNADWRRNAARFKHLDELFKRVKQLEADLIERTGRSGGDEG